MKKHKEWILIVTFFLMVLGVSGCANGTGETISEGGATGSQSEDNRSGTLLPPENTAADGMFSDRDRDIDWRNESYTDIQLADGRSTASNSHVKIEGDSITISEEGTYVLSGSLTNGQIIIDAPTDAKLRLVLNGATIHYDTSAAIYIKEADKVFITLAEGSENTLSNTRDFIAVDENNIDAVVFSKGDLTFNGKGALTIKASYGQGVVSKDDLVFTGGSYHITAANHGLEGKDSVRIEAGSFTIVSGKDGIHAENGDDAALGFIFISAGTIDITAEGDGLEAGASLEIEGGVFRLTTGGGSSSLNNNETTGGKGLKAQGDLLIYGGTFTIDASDDTLHSNGNLLIDEGNFTLASGDDGIHADGKTVINGGEINITGSYEGIGGLSIDITGGEISIVAQDDGLNAAGGNDGSGAMGRWGKDNFTADSASYINISGGKITINASGDGVDSNGNLYVSGGETYVSGPENSGNGALDYNGSAEITGGIFVAAGSSGMAQNFGASSTQGAILFNSTNRQQGGSTILLKDESGKVIVSYTPEKQYQSVVVSAPEIQVEGTYLLEMGTDSQSITMSDVIYGNGGGMGGGPRGMQPGNSQQGGRQRGSSQRP